MPWRSAGGSRGRCRCSAASSSSSSSSSHLVHALRDARSAGTDGVPAASPSAAMPSATSGATAFSRQPFNGVDGGWKAGRGAVAARLACSRSLAFCARDDRTWWTKALLLLGRCRAITSAVRFSASRRICGGCQGLTTRGGLTEYAGGCANELAPAFQRVVEGTMLAGREDLEPPEAPAAVLGGRCSICWTDVALPLRERVARAPRRTAQLRVSFRALNRRGRLESGQCESIEAARRIDEATGDEQQ